MHSSTYKSKDMPNTIVMYTVVVSSSLHGLWYAGRICQSIVQRVQLPYIALIEAEASAFKIYSNSTSHTIS